MDERQEPRTGRVRIIGAEPVGEAGSFADEPLPGDVDGDPTLPHWTEAPTGQVPAVLSSGEDDDNPWRSLPEPTWREERIDWAAQEGAFDPSILAAADEGLDEEDVRQPWSFELDPAPEATFAPVHSRGAHAARQPTEELFGGLAELEPIEDEDPWQYDDPIGVDALHPGAGDVHPGALAGTEEHDEEPGSPRPAAAGRVADEPGGDPPAGPAVAEGPGSPGPAADVPEAEERPGPPTSGRHGTAPRRPGASLRPPVPVSAAVPAGGPGGTHREGGRNLPVAVASGVVLGGLALLCFAFGTVSSMVVATAVVGLAAIEGYAAFRKAGYHPATLLGLVAVVGVMVGVYNRGEAAEPLVLVLLVAFTLLWHLVRVDKAADPVRSTVSTLFVYCWVGVFGSYAALLLSPTVFPQRHGIAYLLGAVITVVAYDVAALGVGSWVGHRPLSAISPNKTWEGLIGGTVVAIVVAVMVVHLIHPWTIGKAAALGVMVAVLAPIGDLAESLVKRHVGVKDMGRVLPGHGGLLDRIDGLLFVLPATYYLVRAFHLG